MNEKCGRILNVDGVVELKQWFTFGCAGYRTSNRSNIVFLFDDTGGYDGTPYVPASSEQPSNEEAARTDNENKPETSVTTTAPVESTNESETTVVTSYEEMTSNADTTATPEETDSTDTSDVSYTTDTPSEETTAATETEAPDSTTELVESDTTSAPFDFSAF